MSAIVKLILEDKDDGKAMPDFKNVETRDFDFYCTVRCKCVCYS